MALAVVSVASATSAPPVTAQDTSTIGSPAAGGDGLALPLIPEFTGGETILPPRRPPGPRPRFEVRAQAQPRECISGIGNPIQPLGPGNSCPPGYRQRVTESYMWGFTTDTDRERLWWGTWTHGMCSNITSYDSGFRAIGANPVGPFTDGSEVTCEFQNALISQQDPAIGRAGDFRRPRVYEYDTKTGRLTERTPDDPAALNISGIRAAGYHDGVVFLAGVELSTTAASLGGAPVRMLAYNAETGEYLGSQRFTQYSNPKVFSVIDGELYAGFNLSQPEPPLPGTTNRTWGQVAKWTGDLDNPFQWEPVGASENQPTYLQKFEGRIVASSWASDPDIKRRAPSGLTLSPPLRAGGLTSADKNNWKTVWRADDFFPDFAKALAQNPARLEELGGWLYTSTVVPPSAYIYQEVLCPGSVDVSKPEELIPWFLKSETPGHVFRWKNLGQPNQTTEVLYGSRQYWAYDCATKTWSRKNNLLDQRPKFGGPGWGFNRWAYYTGWGGAKFRGRIYFSGFDASGVVNRETLNPDTGILRSLFGWTLPDDVLRSAAAAIVPNTVERAADAFYFDDPDEPAKPVTTSGYDNADNWGNRDWFPIGDKKLFTGTQGGWDGFPLPNSGGPPRRPGWQLIELFPSKGPEWPLRIRITLPRTVNVSVRVSIRVRLRNLAGTAVRGVRTCIRLPRGFSLAGDNPGVRQVGRQACLRPGRIPAGGSDTVLLHTVAPSRAESAVVAGLATGREVNVGRVRTLDTARIRVRATQAPRRGGVTG